MYLLKLTTMSVSICGNLLSSLSTKIATTRKLEYEGKHVLVMHV